MNAAPSPRGETLFERRHATGRQLAIPSSVAFSASQSIRSLSAIGTSRWSAGGAATLDDLPLFAAARPRGQAEEAKPSPAVAALAALNPDDLTPKAALDALYRLKGLIGKAATA